VKFLIVVFVIALAGCHETDDVATLHDQAIALGTYYRPQLDAFERRVRDLGARGPNLGDKNLPGNARAADQLKLAANQLADLQSIVMQGAHGKSELENQADSLARDRDTTSLTRLVADTREKLDHDTAVINSELTAAEMWLLEAEASVKPVSGLGSGAGSGEP
jgi:hypothetical protein